MFGGSSDFGDAGGKQTNHGVSGIIKISINLPKNQPQISFPPTSFCKKPVSFIETFKKKKRQKTDDVT